MLPTACQGAGGFGKSLLMVAPSTPRIWTWRARMSHGDRGRNIRPETDRGMSTAPILALDQYEFTERVTGALRRAFGGQKHGVKRLAQAGGMHLGTAKNLLEGKNAPSGLNLLRLAVLIPELGSEIRRLLAMDATHDPEFMRDLSRLIQTAQRIEEVRRASDVLATDGASRGPATGASPQGSGVASRHGRQVDDPPRDVADAAD
jgi:hypothetical protein